MVHYILSKCINACGIDQLSATDYNILYTLIGCLARSSVGIIISLFNLLTSSPGKNASHPNLILLPGTYLDLFIGEGTQIFSLLQT
jgi:hypothetical protein